NRTSPVISRARSAARSPAACEPWPPDTTSLSLRIIVRAPWLHAAIAMQHAFRRNAACGFRLPDTAAAGHRGQVSRVLVLDRAPASLASRGRPGTRRTPMANDPTIRTTMTPDPLPAPRAAPTRPDPWPGWIPIALGAWLFISAFLWPHGTASATNT